MYLCEWQRDDSPTRQMTEKDARAYFKAHQVAGDAAFMLTLDLPSDMRTAWTGLREFVDGRKETPADRAIVSSLRDAWRVWASGDAYVLPTIPVVIRKVARKVAAKNCPHCGLALAA